MTKSSPRRARMERRRIEREWRRCRRSFTYWAEHYCQIPSQGPNAVAGREPFHLYDYQQRWAQAYLIEKMIVTLKSRQLGATTLAMAYSCWLLMFRNGGARIVVISKDQDAASSNLMMLGQMYKWQPAWLKDRGPKFTGDAAQSLKWNHADGGTSLVQSFAATDTVSAGTTPTLVVLDEADLYKNTGGFGSVWGVVEPATLAAQQAGRGVAAIVISTARNPAGAFAKMYWNAKAGKNAFKAFFEPWTSNRFLWTNGAADMAKREAKRQDMLAMGLSHEFERDYAATDTDAFRLAGRKWFSDMPADIDLTQPVGHGRLVRTGAEHGNGSGFRFHADTRGHLRIFAFPEAHRRYVLAVDPAHGDGRDSTVAHVLSYDADGEPFIAAAWYSNLVKQHDAAPELADLGRFYGGGGWDEALMVVETTGGHAEAIHYVLKTEKGYRNLYVHQSKTSRKQGLESKPGMNTAGAGGRRDLVLTNAQAMLPRLGNIYEELATEIATFVIHDNGKVAAEKGLHDDHVMAASIGLFVLAERVHAAAEPTSENQPDTTVVRLPDPIAEAVKLEKARRAVELKAYRRTERRNRIQTRRQQTWR